MESDEVLMDIANSAACMIFREAETDESWDRFLTVLSAVRPPLSFLLSVGDGLLYSTKEWVSREIEEDRGGVRSAEVPESEDDRIQAFREAPIFIEWRDLLFQRLVALRALDRETRNAAISALVALGNGDHDPRGANRRNSFGDGSDERDALVASETLEHTLARLFVRLGPPPEPSEADYAPAGADDGGVRQ